MKLNNGRMRLLGVGIFLCLLFGLLLAQFYQIQIVEGDKWLKEGNKQHFFYVKTPFTRGTFFSNTGIKEGHVEKEQKLVIDIEKFHLYIDPESIPEARKKETASRLITSLHLSKEEGIKLYQQFQKKSRSRKLAMWLDFEEKEHILEWWHPFAKKYKIPKNALYFVSDYKRSYPFGSLLGQVLHTVQNSKDEKTHQAYPTGGLELYFNSVLKGKLGKKRLMRSPRNSLETGEVIALPENGADVYLTINHVLQTIAEEEVEKGVKKYKAKSGWAIMMNPKTGEILALAQYPFFNPPAYQSYFNDPLLIEHTKVKAITDANEIGSTMKPITAAVALLANKELAARGQKPLFSPEEKIATANGNFRGRRKPITDTRLHSYLNMDMAIQKSSNIYMARLVERIIDRLGAEWYRAQLADVFGFGKKTGIELPGESCGALPTPGKKHPNGTFEWSTPTPYSMAFGHNLQANSLQLLRAYAILANGGKEVKPTLIKKIVKNNAAKEILFFQQLSSQKQLIDKELTSRITHSMRFTTRPGGTARKGDVLGFTEAGKTSTAKKIVGGAYSETRYVAGFIGFAPAIDPSFVLLVTLDEPEYGYIPGLGKNHNGGTCTAPVFREIARRSLEYLGTPPDDPFGYTVGDPRHVADKALFNKETAELDALYKKWNDVK